MLSGILQGESLRRGLIIPTFRIEAIGPHLVLHLAQNLLGRGRSLLRAKVLLKRLDEEVQVGD